MVVGDIMGWIDGWHYTDPMLSSLVAQKRIRTRGSERPATDVHEIGQRR